MSENPVNYSQYRKNERDEAIFHLRCLGAAQTWKSPMYSGQDMNGCLQYYRDHSTWPKRRLVSVEDEDDDDWP